uniref:NADH-ubiquinone oxidoreductase chain 3 n=1 Tax=Prosthogonimus cuneatus TaxID=232414 RepID=A0A7L7RYB8_9TREM|nr:NADH dehydrogenase subunit 3 [Prosthogonimus cuneatus]QNU39795.1 NADH dehydrogenase subunit 3 [Prosthogonimus cuneatus]
MVVLFSIFILFLVIFCLVLFFHIFLWDYCFGLYNNVRCWVSSFECGFLSQRLSENYFSSSYFLLLVFFVIFDLEVSLLLNLPFQGVLYKNLGYYYLFILFLCVGFWFEVERGYVSWSV